ncbi:hypothetical protein ACFFGV_13715 [Pontibacillus salicampi]|uniref:Uncharacterized protein n=1 Tax=Pontibacillus salicampi TaxID=1449801 RepID=A0ABV6LQM4_9BACI
MKFARVVSGAPIEALLRESEVLPFLQQLCSRMFGLPNMNKNELLAFYRDITRVESFVHSMSDRDKELLIIKVKAMIETKELMSQVHFQPVQSVIFSILILLLGRQSGAMGWVMYLILFVFGIVIPFASFFSLYQHQQEVQKREALFTLLHVLESNQNTQ